jgi:hypothetical protein
MTTLHIWQGDANDGWFRLMDFDTLREWTCFDADAGKDLAEEVRSYYLPDFSNWKNHDAFEAEFAKLQKALSDEATRHRK